MSAAHMELMEPSIREHMTERFRRLCAASLGLFRYVRYALGPAVATMLRKRLGLSHDRRWDKAQSFSEDWDERTKKLAALVPPESSVLEFGAGRMILREHLPRGCRYTPSDIVDRGQGTLVCNLNEPHLPAFPQHDVVVFSGVAEYVFDLPRVLAHVSKNCRTIVMSYALAAPPTLRVLIRRRRDGWVNDYSDAQIVELLSEVGFACDHAEQWGGQRLYRFRKRDGLG